MARKVWPVPQPADKRELKKQFGLRLRTLLEQRGISQAALSRAVGKPPSEINRYVRGEVWPAAYATQVAIARELGVTVGYLLYGEN